MTDKNSTYKYIAFFFDYRTVQKLIGRRAGDALPYRIGSLHMTVLYMPENVDESLFGEEAEIRVVGYGNDGRNEGFLVEVRSDNEELQRLIGGIEVPHITLSRAEDAESADTRGLDFTPIEPFSVSGRFGGYVTGLGPVTGVSK